ncbi:MAG TPA: nucleotidyltransferase [Spirochaetota bacterium]|nr:nucleotidyltransferase [Spirochaetota bacterium]
MARIKLHSDFKDFLRLLNSHAVEYLLVGGYAVGYHGYPRATGDMDIWIAVNDLNAARIAAAFREFGMPEERISNELFLKKDMVIRMGVPPVRIEVITGASGVVFEECWDRAEVIDINDIPVRIISLEDLLKNKRASGRFKDLNDVEHLPQG